MAEISEHSAENQHIGDGHKGGRVDLVVIRQAEHIHKELKGLEKLFVYQAGGRRVPNRLAGVLNSVINSVDFGKALPEIFLVLLGNPAG